jgi:23S rRNA (adenine2503-C2)-methyltransferase
MGMGEPLDNYDHTVQALKVLTSISGFALSPRRITISTVGYVPGIEKFAHEELHQIKLSVSLHAAIDSKRKKIMPIARRYSLSELVETLLSVRSQFKRTITLEYVLIKEFNDSPRDVTALVALAKKVKAKINIIGYKKIDGVPFICPSDKDIDSFSEQIKKYAIPVTVRYSAGDDISAACGQLSGLLTH